MMKIYVLIFICLVGFIGVGTMISYQLSKGQIDETTCIIDGTSYRDARFYKFQLVTNIQWYYKNQWYDGTLTQYRNGSEDQINAYIREYLTPNSTFTCFVYASHPSIYGLTRSSLLTTYIVAYIILGGLIIVPGTWAIYHTYQYRRRSAYERLI